MTDIFSSFDPAINILFMLPLMFWIFLFSFFIIFSSSFWVSLPTHLNMVMSPLNFMFSQMTRSKGFSLKGLSLIISFLFIFFILINLFGLTPYIFSFSSHLIFTLSFGLPLWLSMIISSTLNSPKEFLAMLLPSGAPAWLSPPLIIIETISMLVRPLTLSFRLAANMSAGHIVLGLVNMYLASAFSTPTSFFVLLMISVIYTLFEVGICMIQAYIFCLLLSLYSDDHTS